MAYVFLVFITILSTVSCSLTNAMQEALDALYINHVPVQRSQKEASLGINAWRKSVNKMSLPYAVLTILPQEIQSHIASYLCLANVGVETLENNLLSTLSEKYDCKELFARFSVSKNYFAAISSNKLFLYHRLSGNSKTFLLPSKSGGVGSVSSLILMENKVFVERQDKWYIVDIPSGKIETLASVPAIGGTIYLGNKKIIKYCSVGSWLIDLTNGKKNSFRELFQLDKEMGEPIRLCIDPTKKYIGAICKSGDDYYVLVWEYSTMKLLKQTKIENCYDFSGIHMSDDYLILNAFGYLAVYTLPLLSIKTLIKSDFLIQNMQVIKNELFLLTDTLGSRYGIEVWDIETNACIKKWNNLGTSIWQHSSTFSSDGYFVLANDRQAFIIDLPRVRHALDRMPFLLAYFLTKATHRNSSKIIGKMSKEGLEYVQKKQILLNKEGLASKKDSKAEFIKGLKCLYGREFGAEVDNYLIDFKG